jgi:uroporphyrinogen III methyltransferase/synthase
MRGMKPGRGAAVLVTRPAEQADGLVESLRAHGIDVRVVPTVALEPLPFVPPRLQSFDWVVVTSPTGVRSLLDRVEPQPGVRWAAVGPTTAAELARRGVGADVVPARARGVELAGAMAGFEPISGRRVLLARATAAGPELGARLRSLGALVEELDVYQTVEGPESSRQALNQALADPRLRTVVFASGSAVRGLVKLAEEDPRRLVAVTIGPATTLVAREHGFEVAAEADRPTVEGLLEVIEHAA